MQKGTLFTTVLCKQLTSIALFFYLLAYGVCCAHMEYIEREPPASVWARKQCNSGSQYKTQSARPKRQTNTHKPHDYLRIMRRCITTNYANIRRSGLAARRVRGLTSRHRDSLLLAIVICRIIIIYRIMCFDTLWCVSLRICDFFFIFIITWLEY